MDPASIIDQVLKEIDRLLKVIRGASSLQIKSRSDRELVKANVFAWFKTHRPNLARLPASQLLENVDDKFRDLLRFADSSTTKRHYIETIQALRKDLIELRSQSMHISAVEGEPGSIENGVPDFKRLIADDRMVVILTRRWEEVILCLKSGASLSATVMMGALLESLLLARINQLEDKKVIFVLEAVPKDRKTKKALPLQDWTLHNFIEVAHEIGWIRKPARDISVVIRDYRNFIHPVKELASGFHIEESDTKMLWLVFSELANQILGSI